MSYLDQQTHLQRGSFRENNVQGAYIPSNTSLRLSFNEMGESARESGVGILMHQVTDPDPVSSLRSQHTTIPSLLYFINLSLQDCSDLRVYVKTCVQGGSADRDGRILVYRNDSLFLLVNDS